MVCDNKPITQAHYASRLDHFYHVTITKEMDHLLGDSIWYISKAQSTYLDEFQLSNFHKSETNLWTQILSFHTQTNHLITIFSCKSIINKYPHTHPSDPKLLLNLIINTFIQRPKIMSLKNQLHDVVYITFLPKHKPILDSNSQQARKSHHFI